MADIDLVEIEGVRLRVSVRGRGRPLLLLNGLGASFELFEPFRAALTETETIAIDAPGTGGSSTTPLPLTIRGVARLMARGLDALGYHEVDALGVSWGGVLAQELAKRHPERVRRLVLCATSLGWMSFPGHPSALRVLMTPRRYYSRSYFERIAPTLYGGAARDDPELLRQHGRLRHLRPPSFRGYMWQLLAIAGWSSTPWLHRLRQPVLVLAADDDPIVPLVNARLMARLLRRGELHVVHRGGHLFVITHAAEVAPVIERFLAEDTNGGRAEAPAPFARYAAAAARSV